MSESSKKLAENMRKIRTRKKMQYLLCYNYVDKSEIRREHQEDTDS